MHAARDGARGSSGPHEAVFVVGPFGMIEDVDPAACALVGYAKCDLVGQYGGELVPDHARPSTAVSLDRMRRGELTTVRNGRLRRQDGRVVDVQVRAERLPGSRLRLRVSEVEK
jgi:PAS domain S-box-containing protein